MRTRRYVKKFMLMRANIQAVSLKIQTLRSTAAMANAMKGVTKAMGQMNKQVRCQFCVLGRTARALFGVMSVSSSLWKSLMPARKAAKICCFQEGAAQLTTQATMLCKISKYQAL